jgi:hypothetical protein
MDDLESSPGMKYQLKGVKAIEIINMLPYNHRNTKLSYPSKGQERRFTRRLRGVTL